jgi:Tfp pilus assembly protein PilN
VQQLQDGSRRRRAYGLSAAALLLLTANTVYTQLRHRQHRDAHADFKNRIDRVVGWPVQAAEGAYALLTAQRELAARKEAYQPVFSAYEPSLLVSLDALLADAVSAGVRIQSLRLKADDVALKGEADSLAGAEALAKALAARGYVTTVEQEVTQQTKVSFEIVATREEPAT